MKELSIKEKAERYDELLKKLQEAKEDNNVCDERYCCVIDDIVPELEEGESEDEKIRKKLIEAVKGDMVVGGTKDKQLAIAWLEKQGEQKPWSEEDNFMYNKIKNLLTDISLAPESIKSLFDWLKDLRDRVQPQTTWKPSDEQMEALEHFVRSIAESGFASPYDSNTKLVYSLLNGLKKLREE